MKKQFNDVWNHIWNRLDDGYGVDAWGGDLHHVLCNEDYFMIGTHKAKKFLGDDAFDIIQMIKEYELENFGECNTDFSDPEEVANMFAYVAGDRILCQSETLIDAFDRVLNAEDINNIKFDMIRMLKTKKDAWTGVHAK